MQARTIRNQEYVSRRHSSREMAVKTRPLKTSKMQRIADSHLARDFKTDENANFDAQKILDSYNSILDEKTVKNHVHDILSGISLQTGIAADNNHQPSVAKNSIPAFVQRARAEVAKADYIRNRMNGKAFLDKDAKTAATLSSYVMPRRASERIQKFILKPHFRGRPSIRSLVRNAIRSELVKQTSAIGLSSLRQYLRRARTERGRINRASTASQSTSLQQAQEAVLAKRVEEAKRILARMEAKAPRRWGTSALIGKNEAVPATVQYPYSDQRFEQHELTSPRYDVTLSDYQQGPIHINKYRGEQEFEEEERHLKSQIDGIFGSNSKSLTAESARKQQTKPEIFGTSLARSPPSLAEPLATAKLTKATHPRIKTIKQSDDGVRSVRRHVAVTQALHEVVVEREVKKVVLSHPLEYFFFVLIRNLFIVFDTKLIRICRMRRCSRS
jgi:hypothetical protein